MDAVTDAGNISSLGDAGAIIQAVRDSDVVAELRRLEGLSVSEARHVGREAVIHVGGHIEPRIRRRRWRTKHDETWWVPSSAIRS